MLASDRIIPLLDRLVADWHSAPDAEPPAPADPLSIVEGLHRRNFQLWHTEDEARRTDVDDAYIAGCKRRIDRLNQARQDQIERLDEALLAAWPWAAEENGLPMNTETPGSVVDRLSIASLKIHHMREQAERADAGEEHRRRCRERLALLTRQRADLAAAFDALAADLRDRRKRMRVYRQFKMYNDPSLNPAVYGNPVRKG